MAPSLSAPSGEGVPPAADTRPSAVLPPTVAEKTIVSSLAQAPPRSATASHSVTVGPPVTAIFFSFPPLKKATHCPSGEKNGLAAPSLPGSATACSRSSLRMNKRICPF